MDDTVKIKLPPQIETAMKLLEDCGHTGFAVGGCVRDSLIGIEPYDWDMATDAVPEQTKECFRLNKTIDTGIKHGTVTVIIDGMHIEITTFRTESGYSDSRRPDRVDFTGSIEDDLSRRDFTICAMAYNPAKGLVDPYCGRDDLARGLIRCVGDAQKRFSEDALRIMRAFRFSAQLGFAIDADTFLAASHCRDRLREIAAERISSELSRLLTSPYAVESLRKMHGCGVLEVIVPGFSGVDIDEDYFTAVGRAPAERITRIALLLRCLPAEGAYSALRELRFDKHTVNTVKFILSEAETPPELSPRGLRQLLRRCGENTGKMVADFLIAVRRLDGWARDELDRIISARECYDIKSLAVSGEDLLLLGLPQTGEMGKMLEYLLDTVIDDPGLNNREALLDITKKRIGSY